MSVIVEAPTIEHHRRPLGIGEERPRISWRISSAPPGWRQCAYRILVVRAGCGIQAGDGVVAVGDVQRDEYAVEVDSGDQILVPWPLDALFSRESAVVRVQVRGEDGQWSEPSEPVALETGLLTPQDWQARPVGARWLEHRDSDTRRPSLVRRDFTLDGDVACARLYASAHGLYEAEINGSRVGTDTLAPGWTSYGSRLRYYTYDVTGLLRPGGNAVGAWLADGWYRGRIGWYEGFRNVFGEDLSFIGQLEVTYTDGRVETIATDRSWRTAPSPILRSGIYDGEDHDARLEQPGWSAPGFDDSGWEQVAVRYRDPATLVAPTAPPVRCTEEVAPVAVLTSPAGNRILDFGQNLAGRVRIRVSGPEGATVRLRTAEVLQDGELYTRPLRSARSTDHYTLAGRSEGEQWEPRFTFHGFRYVEVDGWPSDLDADVADGALVARVLHTDLQRTGWFDCSDELVTKLHENIVWGMRSNFIDVPTDCPQRDERAGWTGDIQVFGPTASYLYDVSGMLAGWLRDVEADQLRDGTVPWYVPVIPAHRMWTPIRPGAAWGDVATMLPWTLYQRFGDAGVLETQYDSASRWVDLVDRLAGEDHLWDEGFQLGDWLDPAAPPDDPADARADRYLVATAYFARSSRLMAQTAERLGKAEDAARYGRLADAVAEAFRAAYVLADGRMTSDAVTAYALALEFDLLTHQQREVAGQRLAELVREAGHRIATGFVGTPLVTDALTSAEELQTAYGLLQERECPSWMYQVEQGATTVWERWDSMLPDGTVNPGKMTSFNHYALGAVADWLHRVVAGLAPAEPGYRRIRFAPRPGGGLTHASARHVTPYGEAATSWEITGGELAVEVTVPVGAEGLLELPGAEPETVGHGQYRRVVAWS